MNDFLLSILTPKLLLQIHDTASKLEELDGSETLVELWKLPVSF